jgi:hypothetical protein
MMAATAIAPIRELDEAAALDWLRAQPGGRVTLTAAELGRRWGWHRQRVGRRLTAWAKSGLVTLHADVITAAGVPVTPAAASPAPPEDPPPHEGRVTVTSAGTAVTPAITFFPAPVTPGAGPVTPAGVTPGIDAAAYTAAVALAGVAAVFSIRGMVTLFPGSPGSVVAMAATMEAAKLVTAAWLAARWSVTPWVARVVLMTFVAGIACINATGVYAQLVSAHVGNRAAAASAVQLQDADIGAQLEVAAGRVADLDKQIAAIDNAIAAATQRGKTGAAVSVMEGQRKARAGLASEREKAAGALAALKVERAHVAAQGRVAESEATPIVYVAEMLGAGGDSEQAIRWLIAVMVICCDPLSISLVAAASAQRGRPA